MITYRQNLLPIAPPPPKPIVPERPTRRGPRRRWSNSEVDIVVQAINQGIPEDPAGRLVGRSQSAVNTLLWGLRKKGDPRVAK